MFDFIRALIFRNDKNRCNFCGRVLSTRDKVLYGVTCEKCEKKLLEKLSNKY